MGLWIKRELPNPEFVTAIVGIGLFAGARVAEQVRAGVAAVGMRLMPAALATGLRPLQAFRLSCCRSACARSSGRSRRSS